jgi:lysyl-tRNA synthetase class 2
MDIEIIKGRARIVSDIRHFFSQRHVLEVDTPILSRAAPTAPYLESFKTEFIPMGSIDKASYYLQTSPEFAMKILLAGGSGSIYQIAKVFRNGERGRLHSPEFTMLEWYRPELNLGELMDEVAALLQTITSYSESVRFSYKEVFSQYLNVNVLVCSKGELQKLAIKKLPSFSGDFYLDRDGWLELLMSQVIEPELASLKKPVFIYNFPASQAQLAKVKLDNDGEQVAARFELYAGGLEVANGYDELLDAKELRKRFEYDNQQRLKLGKAEMPIDEKLLAAMDLGLPPCTGVALGLDRLLMLAMNKESIDCVQNLPFY